MSGRRIALLALIGLIPIALALWVAGFDVFQELGQYVLADGFVTGETALVTAPFDGQVEDVRAEPGQSVKAGQPVFALLRPGGTTPTDVAAPKAGTVILVSAVVGQSVRSGDALATLDVSPTLHAIAFVDERSANSIQPGKRAEVSVDAVGATYQGTVRQLLPAGSVTSIPGVPGTPVAAGTSGRPAFPVWVDFDYGSAPLKLGMSASVKIYR